MHKTLRCFRSAISGTWEDCLIALATPKSETQIDGHLPEVTGKSENIPAYEIQHVDRQSLIRRLQILAKRPRSAAFVLELLREKEKTRPQKDERYLPASNPEVPRRDQRIAML